MIGVGLAWRVAQIIVRARNLDNGGDPADLLGDGSQLAGKLTQMGRRVWGERAAAKALEKKIQTRIDAAARHAGIPENEYQRAREIAQDLAGKDVAVAETRLAEAARTRLATVNELAKIVAEERPAERLLWLNTSSEPAIRLYPIILDAALRHIAERRQGPSTPVTRAVQELLTEDDERKQQLSLLAEYADRIPPVVSDLATRHARHLQDIADRYVARDADGRENFEGRETEIDQISAFATDPTGPHWWWWRAPAWSGKTTLMAHLTFHLPDTVEVVPFFIRRAVAGAGTADDVAAYVVARLAQLAGFTAAPDVRGEWARKTDSIRDLLDLAATSCAWQGKTLLVLLDGLDEDKVYSEDRATRFGSIPALLPATLPIGVKVLLASRRNPELLRREIPETVAGKPHPLRDPQNHRDLKQSDAAKTRRDDAQEDLDELLKVTHQENPNLGDDLFRYVRASGGLLTAHELATLTKVGVPHLAEYLDHKHTARCFTKITDHGPGAVTVYQIAHDGLVDLYTEHALNGRLRYDEDHTDPYEWAQHGAMIGTCGWSSAG